MMMNVLAVGMEVPPEDLEKLRAQCVRDVKETNGSISYSDFQEQFYVTADRVLRTEGPYPDEQPEMTRFAQEVRVPRSTR